MLRAKDKVMNECCRVEARVRVACLCVMVLPPWQVLYRPSGVWPGRTLCRTDVLAVQGFGMLRAKDKVAVKSSRVEARVRVVHGCDDFAVMILQMK